jgi:prepilin-type N-terminal cleavage/methylation domain-containing protein
MMIRNEDKGFTLIELVTVIVVLSILGLFIFSFINHATRTYTLVRGQSALYADGTYIMERITRELSDATKVTDPAAESSSSTLTFDKAHTGVDLITTVTFKQDNRDLLRNGTLIGKDIIKTFNVTRRRPGVPLDETIEIKLELNNPKDTSIPDFVLRTKVTPNNYGGGYTGRSFNGDYYETIQ